MCSFTINNNKHLFSISQIRLDVASQNIVLVVEVAVVVGGGGGGDVVVAADDEQQQKLGPSSKSASCFLDRESTNLAPARRPLRSRCFVHGSALCFKLGDLGGFDGCYGGALVVDADHFHHLVKVVLRLDAVVHRS
jgi:hypothetical protein